MLEKFLSYISRHNISGVKQRKNLWFLKKVICGRFTFSFSWTHRLAKMLSIEYILYDKCLYNCINIFLKFKNWVIPYSIWQKTKKIIDVSAFDLNFFLAIAFEFYLKYLLCCMHANPSGQWLISTYLYN